MYLAAIDFGPVHTDAIIQNAVGSVLYFLVGVLVLAAGFVMVDALTPGNLRRQVFVERRPDRGLLGGMLGLPGTDWADAPPAPQPPFPADWRDLGVEARHTFTHFHLRLTVLGACVGLDTAGDFRPAEEAAAAMPTVMRKALRLGLGALAR